MEVYHLLCVIKDPDRNWTHTRNSQIVLTNSENLPLWKDLSICKNCINPLCCICNAYEASGFIRIIQKALHWKTNAFYHSTLDSERSQEEANFIVSVALKSAALLPLNSTFAFQHGLGKGRWMVSPEIRKCYHLEIHHRSGSSGFGHVEIGVMERNMLGTCMQKLIYYSNSFSGPHGTGKGGIHPWARNDFYVLFQKILNTRDITSKSIYPSATGGHILVCVHVKSFFGGQMCSGSPHLHHAQKRSLDCVFSFFPTGALVLIQTMLL